MSVRYLLKDLPLGPPRTRISFAEKLVHGGLIAAGILGGPAWILG